MKTSIKKLLSLQLGAGGSGEQSSAGEEALVNPAALTSRVQKSVSAGIKYSGIAHTGTCSN